MAKTGQGLVQFVQKAFAEKWGYVWGIFGDRPLTDTYLKQKITQYPKEVGGKESVIRNLWMGRIVADTIIQLNG